MVVWGHYDKDDGKAVHQLGIELASVDGYYLEDLLNDIGSRNKVSDTARGTKSISIVSEKMISDLEKYGVVPQKTNKVSLKNVLEKVPSEYHNLVLLGYFEGNGHLSKEGSTNELDISTGSYEMANDIFNLLGEVVGQENLKLIHQDNCHRVRIYKEKTITDALTYLYTGSDLDRALKRKFLMACEKSETVNSIRAKWLLDKARESSFVLPEKVLDKVWATFFMSRYLDDLRESYIKLIMSGITQERLPPKE
ncbi:hypothetical protein COJ48_24845 [Bacillus cereus]|nr:hypothetical protein COJ48_24845 [Bacillus cereus]PGP86675.1 hypothetical protein CN997_05955 [Bacillus cereus]